MISWTVELYDKNNNFICEVPFEGLEVVFELNGFWSASVSTNIFDLRRVISQFGMTVEDLLSGGFRWAKIKREDEVVFSGFLTEPSIRKAGKSIDCELFFNGWLSYFRKRFITKQYEGVDAGQIAWDLISTAQSEAYGDIGVTQGTIEATVDRDRTYVDDEVANAIVRLSAFHIDNGFDFEISNDRVFTVKQRLGSDKPYIVFDNTNIKNWRVNFGVGLSLTNRVIGLGAGMGEAQLRVVRDADSAYQSKWYLLEERKSWPGVERDSTLNAHCDEVLNRYRDTFKEVEIDVVLKGVSLSDFNVGDGVKVKIEDLVDDLYRIKKKRIVLRGGEEVINLGFVF